MIPDSVILLTPEARLDALLYALEASRNDLRGKMWHVDADEAWERCGAAWEALHGELMNQLKGKGESADK